MVIYYIIAIIVYLVDQGSKRLIVDKMQLHENRSVIGEFFQITYFRNTGAAFSILENQRWFFVIITIVVVIGIVWYMRRLAKQGSRSWMLVALSLILGGALGNFSDRAIYGNVVDFLQLRFQFSWFGKAIDYTYPIFNLADSAIVIGVIMIFLDALRGWWNEKRGQTEHESHGS